MRTFPPDYDHAAVAQFLRREAKKGFQRGDDPISRRYVEACNCGVNLFNAPDSVSLTLTRDFVLDYKIGWHLSVCCVTSSAFRGYVPEEGEYWKLLVFGWYSSLAVEQPLAERTPLGVQKDVRHWLIECDWGSSLPVVTLEGL